jgi:hypothetical protein
MWTLAFGHHEDRTPTHGLRSDARGRHGGVRQELAAGAILVCAANCPIGENNSSLEMARVDELARILGHLVGKPERPRFRGTKRYGIIGPTITPA